MVISTGPRSSYPLSSTSPSPIHTSVRKSTPLASTQSIHQTIPYWLRMIKPVIRQLRKEVYQAVWPAGRVSLGVVRVQCKVGPDYKYRAEVGGRRGSRERRSCMIRSLSQARLGLWFTHTTPSCISLALLPMHVSSSQTMSTTYARPPWTTLWQNQLTTLSSNSAIEGNECDCDFWVTVKYLLTGDSGGDCKGGLILGMLGRGGKSGVVILGLRKCHWELEVKGGCCLGLELCLCCWKGSLSHCLYLGSRISSTQPGYQLPPFLVSSYTTTFDAVSFSSSFCPQARLCSPATNEAMNLAILF